MLCRGQRAVIAEHPALCTRIMCTHDPVLTVLMCSKLLKLCGGFFKVLPYSAVIGGHTLVLHGCAPTGAEVGWQDGAAVVTLVSPVQHSVFLD